MVAKLLALNPGVDSVVLPVNKLALSAFQAEYILGNKKEPTNDICEPLQIFDICKLLQIAPIDNHDTTQENNLARKTEAKIITRLDDTKKGNSNCNVKQENVNTALMVNGSIPIKADDQDQDQEKVQVHLETRQVQNLRQKTRLSGKIIIRLEDTRKDTCKVKNKVANDSSIDNGSEFRKVKSQQRAKKKRKKKESAEIYICEKCPKTFEAQKDLYTHKISHRDKTVPCNQCDAKFKTIGQMQAHMRRHGQGQVCPKCGGVVKWLKRHLKESKCGIGENANMVKYPCSLCEKTFVSKLGLRAHKKHIHEKIKNYVCHSCDYRTYSRSNLAMHVESQHEGKKLVKKNCPLCKMKPMWLEAHMASYHGTSPIVPLESP